MSRTGDDKPAETSKGSQPITLDYMSAIACPPDCERRRRFWRMLLIGALIHQALQCALLIVNITEADEPGIVMLGILPAWKKLAVYWVDHHIFFVASAVIGFWGLVAFWLMVTARRAAYRLVLLYCIFTVVFVALDILASIALTYGPPVTRYRAPYRIWREIHLLSVDTLMEPLLATLPVWVVLGGLAYSLIWRRRLGVRSVVDGQRCRSVEVQ